jgi:hypothetical protein
MRCLAILLCFITIAINSLAQHRVVDSIKQALTITNDDSVRFRLLIQAGEYYAFINSDSSMMYTRKAIDLAENN